MKNSLPLSVFSEAAGTLDLVCLSHLRWDFVTQRPQHLMRRAARTRRVFFVEEPFWHSRVDSASPTSAPFLDVSQREPNLWVVQPHLYVGTDPLPAQEQLLADLSARFEINACVRWLYTAMALPFSAALPAAITVYDCMDELSAFLGAPADLLALEHQLFTEADVVFTGGLSLFEAKRAQHPNVHASPSSIDLAHFRQAITGNLPEPADQASIPHPRAGFYGVLDERFDLDLLRSVAALRPSIHFILLGPVVKIDPATLPQAPNIHYLSAKSYDDLPAYLATWDVALLPFALNPSTRFISPTKTPEYLAAGKPVISTAIRDVERTYGDSGLVAIARSPEHFATLLDASLLPHAAEWQQRVVKHLSKLSWDATWQAMDSEMSRALSLRDPAHHTSLPPVPSHRANSPLSRSEHFDFVVVGAGFAGSVLAERLASQLDRRVLLVDKRTHIAGNAYDCLDAAGILIHLYGPHIFHTNSTEVVDYLSRFTAWRPYEHRVLASVDGQLLPIPINLDTVNRLYQLDLDPAGMEAFLAARTERPAEIRTSADIVISRVGRELYEKFFRNYTRKQWGLDPSELDASVAGRIPVRFNHDDRYFTDSFQAMPREGYTHMFERMLDHPNITLRLGVDFQTMRRTYPDAEVIYTGPIDEFFGFRFGPLPYRSLNFQHQTHRRPVFQQAPVVNFPNDHDYTRVTEFKYLTGQQHKHTSIVYEYPRSTGDPYYPIPRPENAATFAQYRELASKTSRVHFCGRLANYRYFNMDQVVAQALSTFRNIAEQHRINLIPSRAPQPSAFPTPAFLATLSKEAV